MVHQCVVWLARKTLIGDSTLGSNMTNILLAEKILRLREGSTNNLKFTTSNF